MGLQMVVSRSVGSSMGNRVVAAYTKLRLGN